MQPRARTFVTSAALVAALTGILSACTGSSDSGGDGGETQPGGTSASEAPAAPGKYRTLPEPCGEVSLDTLEEMLPGAEPDGGDDGSGSSASPSPYEGEASVTYDTDRRVGCTWQSATSLGSRHLTVDFERVVSYDPAVSDDEQTDQLYAERAQKAGVDPSADPTETEDSEDSEDTETPGGGEEPGGATPDGGKNTGESPGADPSGSPSDAPSDSPSVDEALPSRTLDGIGDAAFLDDELVSSKSGRATHRDIKLVFRTANVLVTVEYTQSVADERRTPDSAELQEQAQELARQLAGTFDDS